MLTKKIWTQDMKIRDPKEEALQVRRGLSNPLTQQEKMHCQPLSTPHKKATHQRIKDASHLIFQWLNLYSKQHTISQLLFFIVLQLPSTLSIG